MSIKRHRSKVRKAWLKARKREKKMSELCAQCQRPRAEHVKVERVVKCLLEPTVFLGSGQTGFAFDGGWSVAGTRTGRLSSASPNLSNVPRYATP